MSSSSDNINLVQEFHTTASAGDDDENVLCPRLQRSSNAVVDGHEEDEEEEEEEEEVAEEEDAVVVAEFPSPGGEQVDPTMSFEKDEDVHQVSNDAATAVAERTSEEQNPPSSLRKWVGLGLTVCFPTVVVATRLVQTYRNHQATKSSSVEESTAPTERLQVGNEGEDEEVAVEDPPSEPPMAQDKGGKCTDEQVKDEGENGTNEEVKDDEENGMDEQVSIKNASPPFEMNKDDGNTKARDGDESAPSKENREDRQTDEATAAATDESDNTIGGGAAPVLDALSSEEPATMEGTKKAPESLKLSWEPAPNLFSMEIVHCPSPGILARTWTHLFGTEHEGKSRKSVWQYLVVVVLICTGVLVYAKINYVSLEVQGKCGKSLLECDATITHLEQRQEALEKRYQILADNYNQIRKKHHQQGLALSFATKAVSGVLVVVWLVLMFRYA